jgi:tetratricopeptide (TPR) repeat protein
MFGRVDQSGDGQEPIGNEARPPLGDRGQHGAAPPAGTAVTEPLNGPVEASPAAPSVSAPPPPARRVARYQLVEMLGSGGMGSVYRAHDPDLSRDVALKILHQRYVEAPHGHEYHQRLLREAQALAKLSHPNVVAAFDVGTHADVLFVAMELVQGESLRDWLTQTHSSSEVLRVLIAAGRGLVAAHTAGVTHRDFKPANVMVSPDGRVRVVDFGLARAAGSVALQELPVPARSEALRQPSLLDSELTEPGLLMGTPGYVAPEQLRGQPADELTDQYGYAVTSFVALTGRRPPSGTTIPSPRGSFPPPPRPVWPRSVPRRIRRVIERGLEPERERRHASVAAMVDALEAASAPPHKLAALVALALGAMLLAASAVFVKARTQRVTCQVDASSFRGIWDAERRQALERGFLATGRATAGEAFGRLATRLDAFESNWLSMKQESCEATHVRGEQSEKVLGLRNACLQRKFEGYKALIAAFDQPVASAVDRAAGALPDSIGECADTAVLLGVAEQLPTEPAARATIEDIESGFGVSKALMTAGRWREAIEQADALLNRAREAGHDRTIAHAQTELARATYASARTSEERKQAELLLREGLRLAARVGDDRLVAQTSSYIFTLISYGQNRSLEADAMLPHVEALVLRAGNDPEQEIELAIGQARVLSQRHKYPEAIEFFEKAIALSESMQNEQRTYGAYAQGEIGEVYMELGNYPEAVSRMQAALAGIRLTFGDHHSRVLVGLANLAIAQSKAKYVDAARATVAQMRELAATLPPEDWRAVTIPFLEGEIWEDSGDCPRAIPHYREALSRFSKVWGADDLHTADVNARLGACLVASPARAEGLAQLERALSLYRSKGAAPNIVAKAAFELAAARWPGGASERKQALVLAREARELWQQDDVTDKLREVEAWLSERDALAR